MEKNRIESKQGGRLVSLDALRGLDMLFLTGLAGIFRALPKLSDNNLFNWLAGQSVHPEWQGFTAYDLIFPMFIFIVGVAMPFSFSRRLEKGNTKKDLLKHVVIRAIILAVLGIIRLQVPGGPHEHWGFYTVLYRIGFSYFFAALIMLNTNVRGQAYWAFGLAIGYWILLRFVPVPGYGAGDFSKDGNLTTYLGNLVAQYISPDFRYVFSFSLVTSVSNALFGVLAGHWLRSGRNPGKIASGLFIAGIVAILVAMVIHIDFPVNKNLGTTSFTFLTCGISAALLALFYWIIDVKGYKKWAFFLVVVGVNSITVYMASALVKFGNIANVFIGGFNLGNAQPLVYAVTVAIIIWLFLYYLYRQKIFLKI